VIAKDTQYFIAEATKTLDLVDNNKCEEEGDALWRTVELPPNAGTYPCFTVTDLSSDERFSQLPFVTGDPHFRFYAGTPLTTKNGVNIGSLFVLDTKVRPKLSPTQERFLGTIAATVMGHLEVNREAEERSKVLHMAKGLNAFVEGKSSFSPEGQSDEKTAPVPVGGVLEEIESTHTNIEGAHKATFSRAANLLSDSLRVRDHGGVCFLDTTTGPQNVSLRRTGTVETESESDARDSPRKPGTAKTRNNSSFAHDRRPGDIKEPRRAEVIGFSGSMPKPLSQDENRNLDTFVPLEERFLQSLLKHYPRGKVWIFDGAEGLTSEEDDRRSSRSRVSEDQAHRKLSRKISEKEILRQCFPDAFSHSIMGEVSRLASLYESRQKGDFIGSISHELRSPLHGILASAEFLSETNFDAFQGNLVDTISSCGRTLLDTIEHILDFSKINSFERNWRNARKPKASGRFSNSEAVKKALAKDTPPLMSIYAVTDVAAIVEEVVEGVYAGQIYRDFGSVDVTAGSASHRGQTSDRLSAGNASIPGGSAEQRNARRIEVILDIAQDDYCFVTQPGALRRVVMNIFGNSLKYTLAGKIIIRLRLEELETQASDKAKSRMLEITVTDTAFAQEDVLANGTGLGLSIVRSIVSMLEGSIDIKSQVGEGTEVQIRLPLKREAALATPVSTPSSVGSPDKLQDNSISILQKEHPAKKISVYDANVQQHGQVTETSRMASYYVEYWFHFKDDPEPSQRLADVIVVEERLLPDLLKLVKAGPAIVVLCSKTHRLQPAETLYDGAIEFTSIPFGPYKLAKAIRLSLEKANDFARGNTPQAPFKVPTPQMSEAETIVPEFEMMTLETDNEETPIHVQTNGVVTASSSNNARMALGSSSSGASTDSRRDFPFPSQSSNISGPGSPQSPHLNSGDIFGQPAKRPKLSSRKTEPLFRPSHRITSTLTPQGALATSDARHSSKEVTSPHQVATIEPQDRKIVDKPSAESEATVTKEKRSPRLLLVDDNKINLRLLETFMHKRKYEYVDSAMDGKLALEAAERHKEGYDIIFMDLSMPIMNGFESTRAIRDFERTRDHSKYARPPKAALIIALTGLASGRDHGEAFACGVDLYMTKPVSFKEVGRLLDNWEAHGGLEARTTSMNDEDSDRREHQNQTHGGAKEELKN
ncbi:MAG: hypothetical protein Q9204_003843, partial [Flavoplaca sp. TL-2023a]